MLAWAALHQDELRENWRRARAGEKTEVDRAAPMIGLTPDIIEAAVIRHGVLRIRFADGLRGEVEVFDRMRGPVFEQPRTPQRRPAPGPHPQRTMGTVSGATRRGARLVERARGSRPERSQKALSAVQPSSCSTG